MNGRREAVQLKRYGGWRWVILRMYRVGRGGQCLDSAKEWRRKTLETIRARHFGLKHWCRAAVMLGSLLGFRASVGLLRVALRGAPIWWQFPIPFNVRSTGCHLASGCTGPPKMLGGVGVRSTHSFTIYGRRVGYRVRSVHPFEALFGTNVGVRSPPPRPSKHLSAQ